VGDTCRRAAGAAVFALIAAALAACGGGPHPFDAAVLGLPSRGAPAPLATATLATSPDGGIYRNPDHLEVVLIGRHSADAIAAQIGRAASAWSQLRRFGEFTFVALRLRDDGKASSDPLLGDLQLASDYAPPGTASGPLRHFYHPTYPLAVVADSKPGDDCSIHLDPGHSGVAILVYPPVELPATVVWGRLGDFVLSIHSGGALPPLAGALHAVACSPPTPPPA
jgi:hypothetical protein